MADRKLRPAREVALVVMGANYDEDGNERMMSVSVPAGEALIEARDREVAKAVLELVRGDLQDMADHIRENAQAVKDLLPACEQLQHEGRCRELTAINIEGVTKFLIPAWECDIEEGRWPCR